MSILLHKPYLVKWSTKGGGGVKNVQKSVHMVYGRPLPKTPGPTSTKTTFMDFGMILKHFLLYGTLIPKPDSTEVQMMDL